MIEILVSGFFLSLGLTYKKKINPLVVFNGIWFICFFLYRLGFSSAYDNKIPFLVSIVFVSMLITFNVGFILGKSLKNKRGIVLKISLIKARTKEEYLNIVFHIYFSLIIIEVILFKGVPLLWTLQGRTDVSYVTFGIPSLHGFINSLAWFIVSISFIELLNSKSKVALRNIIMINLIFVLLLARQSMVTEIIQLMTIYFCKRRLEVKKLCVLLLLFVIGFGLIGNLRTPPEVIIRNSGFRFNVPIFLLGIVWVYMYMISPIANIIYFIENFTNFQYGIFSLINLLPTVVVNRINITTRGEVGTYLVNEAFNMSTGLMPIYGDFGVIGIALFFTLIGLMGGVLWRKMRCSNYSDEIVCMYSIYSGAIALMFFFNEFITLPIIIQFIYSSLLFRNYFYCRNKNDHKEIINSYIDLKPVSNIK